MANPFIGSTRAEQGAMLAALGIDSIDSLYDAVVPREHQFAGELDSLGQGIAEASLRVLMDALAASNTVFERGASFAGAGFYQRAIPEAVAGIVGTGDWYTPYTPYQAEVAQGILATLFDSQSYMSRLTGMAVVNAGLYHGANALAEAALMALRIKNERNKIVVSDAVHPVAVRNLQTYFRPKGIELVFAQSTNGVTLPENIERVIDGKTAAVIVQNPNFRGLIDGMDGQADAAHSKDALYIVYGGGDQISLAMLKPAEYGADIYAGEGQHLGIPIGFGGPHVGVLGIRDTKNVRQLPGRLVGETRDVEGNRRYVLVLQTREQHIRREHATSNTCTAETLISVMCTAYLATMGPQGLREAARQSNYIAGYLAGEISRIRGYRLLHPDAHFFNEFAIAAPCRAEVIVDELAGKGILAGVPVAKAFPYGSGMNNAADNVLLIAATEANSRPELVERLLMGLGRYAN